ncbi:MAG: sulfurtransferase [Thermoleophilia bacterium]
MEQHLGAPDVRLVEVDEDTTAYSRGHLPGAISWHWRDELRDPQRRDPLSADDLAVLLRRSGVGPDTRVVLYGSNANWFAAYAYWVLRLRGFDAVRLMDGGRRLWEIQGRRLTRTVVQPNPQPDVTLAPGDNRLRTHRDALLRLLEDPTTQLVDVRAPTEFRGEMLAPPHLPEEQGQVPGRIPGSVNVPWFDTVNEDGSFRSTDELRELFAHKGAAPRVDCVVYSRVGERGSHTWFALRELAGHPRASHYDGGWAEYGSLVGVPVISHE